MGKKHGQFLKKKVCCQYKFFLSGKKCKWSLTESLHFLWKSVYFYRNLLSREKGFEDYDAIIFVVDSADRNSLEEARQELWNVLCLAPNFMMQQHLTVLLIMANKQDVKGAATTQEIETILGPKLTLQNSVNGLKKGAKNDSEKNIYSFCFRIEKSAFNNHVQNSRNLCSHRKWSECFPRVANAHD